MNRTVTLLLYIGLTLLPGAAVSSAQNTPPELPDMLTQIGSKGDFAPMFPFSPTHNVPENITNVRTWAGVDTRPAGADGFVLSNGSYFIGADGKPKRFLGTNIGMKGCFPDHESSERMSRELARYGVNIVRMHYVSHRTPKNGYPVQDSFIEPVQLERFDYLFAKLKEQGIYVYFQLNIARKITNVNGFENSGKLPKYKNGVDNVDFRMIQLQKRFHYEILNHVNPYTGIAYKDDPAITMLEHANENSLVDSWFDSRKMFPWLVEPYKERIVGEWNRWLQARYGSTEKVKEAWMKGIDGDGKEIIPEGIMSTFGKAGWDIQLKKGGAADWEYVKAKGFDRLQGKYYARLSIEKANKSAENVLLFWSGIRLEAGKPYCLKFKARANVTMPVTIRMGMNHTPWTPSGFKLSMKIPTEWKEYTYNFIPSAGDNDMRFVIGGFKAGTVDIADLSLVNGMDYSFPEGQRIEDETLGWPLVHDWQAPPQRAVDFTEFMADMETRYFLDLYKNTKEYIKAPQNIGGTQLGYGFNLPQAYMDYCDIHGYWCHPGFRGAWKWDHFHVRNDAIVSTGTNGQRTPATVMTNIAKCRILGRPFTVSEYDHPNLNFYCAEGNVMMSALGAFQNWSGLMQFAWILDEDFDREYMHPMFDMCTAPQKLVHFPACYSMFVRGDVRRGSESIVFAYPSEKMRDVRMVAQAHAARADGKTGSDLLDCLPLAVVSGRQVLERPEIFPTEGKTIIRSEADVPDFLREQYENKLMKSTTGELTWNWQQKDAGVFMVDTGNTKAFSGFVRGRTFTYRGMTLVPGKTRLDWLTLTLTLANPYGKSRPGNILVPGEYLLAATGQVANTGEKIVAVRDKPRNISCSVPEGGNVGTAPVLCEGIDAVLNFAALGGRLHCYALDPDGNRTCEVPVSSDEQRSAVLHITPEYKTVWYELIVDEIKR